MPHRRRPAVAAELTREHDLEDVDGERSPPGDAALRSSPLAALVDVATDWMRDHR